MLKDFAPFNFRYPLKVWNYSNLLQNDQQVTVGQYQDIWELLVTKNLYITYINQRISIRNEMCFALVSCVPANLEPNDKRKSTNEAWSACHRYNRFFAKNIDSKWDDRSHSNLWKSTDKESKGFEIQGVSNS